MPARGTCPDCGAHVPLSWWRWVPDTGGAQVACADCGRRLVFPRSQQLAWAAAAMGVFVALEAAYRPVSRSNLEVLLLFAAFIVATAAFRPFWRLEAYDPSRSWGFAEGLLVFVAWVAFIGIAIWFLTR
jgi:hypothetical protein